MSLKISKKSLSQFAGFLFWWPKLLRWIKFCTQYHASKPADTQLTGPMMMFSVDGSSPCLCLAPVHCCHGRCLCKPCLILLTVTAAAEQHKCSAMPHCKKCLSLSPFIECWVWFFWERKMGKDNFRLWMGRGEQGRQRGKKGSDCAQTFTFLINIWFSAIFFLLVLSSHSTK